MKKYLIVLVSIIVFNVKAHHVGPVSIISNEVYKISNDLFSIKIL